MSEINRVGVPYGSQAPSNKAKNVAAKTIRLTIKLPQSNEDRCPEYNYKDQLDAAEKRLYKGKQNGEKDIMFDDDGDVRRIAQEMEEKYGKGIAVSKRRRKNNKDEYADIGMGYDETDSFIDNTDGYDEIIPQHVTTLHGGFYINCGALEFKTDDESSDSSSSSSADSTPSHRKRIIESSDESEDEENSKNADKKLRLENGGVNGVQKALKKKLFNHNKIQVKKKRLINPHKKTVKDLLREKREDLNLTGLKSTTDMSTNDQGENETADVNVSSITDAIESVIKASEDVEVVNSETSVAESKSPSNSSQNYVEDRILPENLPSNIVDIIKRIETMILSTGNFGPNHKFNTEVNNLLLSMERRCKCLGKPSKTKVYEHVSNHMKIDKSVLITQCNKLVRNDEERKVRSLLEKLKKEINQEMPSILTSYEKECQALIQKRSTLQTQEKDEGSKTIRMPKRKFVWNDLMKKLLKDITSIQKRIFAMDGKSKENIETEMTLFLKNSVLILWPEGWMTILALKKEFQRVSTVKRIADNKVNSVPNAKKEPKTATAQANSAASNFPFPSISITPVVSASSSNNHKTASTKNSIDIKPVHEKEKLPEAVRKEKPHPKFFEGNGDHRNNNSDTFLKIDYDKSSNTANNKNTIAEKETLLVQEVIDVDSIPEKPVTKPKLNNILPEVTFMPFNQRSDNYFKKPSESTAEVQLTKKHEKPLKSVTKLLSNEVTLSKSNSQNSKAIPSEEILLKSTVSDGDDIQKVMEHLRNLQKMASPIKSIEIPSTVSNSRSSSSQESTRPPVVKNLDITNSFQDEFQKQYLSSLSAPTSSKSNYKCS